MLSHSRVWQSIDEAADSHGLSVSGLAKRAGLDPTSFNKSKRYATDGRPRWPSTESISKVIECLEMDIEAFFAASSHNVANLYSNFQSIPMIGFARAGHGGFFDDGGFPVGQGWSEVQFPSHNDRKVYALEVQGDSMLPLYRDGDTLIVEPGAQIKSGDRVVIRTTDGEVMAKVLVKMTDKEVLLQSVNRDYADPIIPNEEMDWIARIAWVSQ